METLSALLTPVIACIALWIAYQQYKTNRRAESRQARNAQIAVYKEIKSLLNHIDTHRDVPDKLFDSFLSAAAEADFLFDETMSDWLSVIQSEVDQYKAWEMAIFELKKEHGVITQPDEILREKAPKDFEFLDREMESIIDRLQDCHCQLFEKFRPFLSLK